MTRRAPVFEAQAVSPSNEVSGFPYAGLITTSNRRSDRLPEPSTAVTVKVRAPAVVVSIEPAATFESQLATTSSSMNWHHHDKG